ncbi:G-protein coupled receptor 55-like isoform X1 [Chiloscyllium plagiosum]|uniref:G-protein coupled receptor 55-like isoform X1 n=1 Tax=Chiloscyllium plagiosum TaxID=36176 RepID=UPI001CB846B9|nr:G-protein coupled receptor 55-like isoform X1 [Chiloscyllium plagiosum]
MCNLNNTTDLQFVKTFQYVVYIPTFILGLIINLVALWILCIKSKKLIESTIYMINLIFSDIFLLFSLPFKIHADQMNGVWELGPIFCKFVESLYFVNTYGTILLITLISLDRYIAIKHPFLAQALRSPKKAIIVCTVMWICIWSASIPNYIQPDRNQKKEICFVNFDEFWERGIIPVSMEVIFLTSAVTVSFCSIQIIRTLRRVDEERDDMNMRTSLNIVSSNLVTFLFCFTPYHIAMLLYLLARKCYISEYLAPLRVFLKITQCLVTINCCLDGMYYYLIIKNFWKLEIRSIEDTNSTHTN